METKNLQKTFLTAGFAVLFTLLVSASTAFSLTLAIGINGAGQIVGDYMDAGGTLHGFVATP
jgi:hypothetical protein